jgi:hypothetical protein
MLERDDFSTSTRLAPAHCFKLDGLWQRLLKEPGADCLLAFRGEAAFGQQT